MLIIPYFRDGVVVKSTDLERLKIYSHDLAVAASNTSGPGILYGMNFTLVGSNFVLQPGAARLDSGEIVVIDSSDNFTVPFSSVTAAVSGVAANIYLYKQSTTLVSDRQNLANVAQIVADKWVCALSFTLPTVTDKVLLGQFLFSGAALPNLIFQGFERNPANATNTHTGTWANNIYTGPRLHGTSAIIPLSITAPSINTRTITNDKIVDRELIRRNINQEFGLVMPGTVMAYAGVNLSNFTQVVADGPSYSGWLLCNGVNLPTPSSSASPFYQLHQAIGFTYGAAEGNVRFYLPDLRGVFIRGYESRATSDVNNRDPDRNGAGFGQYQGDAVRNHRHRQINGYDDKNFSNSYGQSAPGDGTAHTRDGRETTYILGETGVNVSNRESRPKNIAMHYIIYTGEYYIA